MADVNAGISDLRNWEKIRASELNVTKEDDKYYIKGYVRSGHERFLYKVSVQKNKKYRFSLFFNYENNPTFSSNGKLAYALYISKTNTMDYLGDYGTSITNEIASLHLIGYLHFDQDKHDYSLIFDSGEYNEVYVVIGLDGLTDGNNISVEVKNIEFELIKTGPDYLIESAYKTGYYFKDGEKMDTFCYMVLIRDEDILGTLPQEITPGSWAYTAAGKKVWQMDFDREWIPAFDEDE